MKRMAATILTVMMLFTAVFTGGTVYVEAAAERVQDAETGINPLASTSLFPADGDYVPGTTITFRWEAVEGAQNYNLRIIRQSDGTVFYNRMTGSSSTSHSVSNFSNDSERYRWEVRALTDEGWGDFSHSQSFINDERRDGIPDPDPTEPDPTDPTQPTDRNAFEKFGERIDVDIRHNFIIDFSDLVDPSTINTNNIWVEDSQGNRAEIELIPHATNRKRVIVRPPDWPTGSYQEGAIYTIFVGQGIRSHENVPLLRPVRLDFKTHPPIQIR